MKKRVLMIHYTPPGVIGGVEHIMYEHIHQLTSRGFETQIVAGRAAEIDVPLHVIPELDAATGPSMQIEAELARGIVSDGFHDARRAISAGLAPLISWADTVITHNAYTLHFSLPLTAVLWDLGRERSPDSMIAWCHDLAWINPLYKPHMHDGFPWSLLREPAPNTRYVVISQERRLELLSLWGQRGDDITVVPNGIDVRRFLKLSPVAQDIVERLKLFQRDIVILLPVRITRRKNVQAGIATVRVLKDRGLDVLFLVSGPQAPHHPGLSDVYFAHLKDLRRELDLENEVIFLTELLQTNVSLEAVSDLYRVSDVLLFPSSQEGFGLPILEAGLARVPAVLSDIPIFREVGGADVQFFDLKAAPDQIADEIIRSLDSPASRLYKRIRREFDWDAIVDRDFIPLLQRSDSSTATRKDPAIRQEVPH